MAAGHPAPASPDLTPASRSFRVGVWSIALAVAFSCLWIAWLEWFSRDVFAFLAHVRTPGAWSWLNAFWPVDQRFWPFYRPLGMETYFYLGHQLFGLNATGYFAISLAVHFASGFLVYRIARQLGLDTRVAAVGLDITPQTRTSSENAA